MLTDKGYIKRTAEEIKKDLLVSIKQSVPEFTEQPADLQSDLLNTSIESMLVYENMMSALFNAYSPDFSNDDLFLKFAESLGLRQKAEFKAQTTLTFTGKYGDFIPKNTIVTDEAGTCEFKTQDNAVCDSVGVVNVLALSETEEVFQPNKLTKIKTILGGNISVTNKVASLKYIPSETIASVKARAQAKLRSVRQGGKLYADQLLKGIDGVDSRLVAFYDKTIKYEKNEKEKKEYYIKGIEAVIGGGTDVEVAKALYLSFIETQKLISNPSDKPDERKRQVVIYIYDNPVVIEFTRPKLLEIEIIFKVTFTDITSTPLALEQLTQKAVTDYVNNLKVGIGINKFSLIKIVMPILIDAGIPAYTIKTMDFMYKLNGSESKAFNSDGFIPEILFDCYCILTKYGVEINA